MPEINFPTLHSGQVSAVRVPGRFKAIRCGRRWGKSRLLETIAAQCAANRGLVGFFAPDYKILSETYNETREILDPIVKSSSKIDGTIYTTTGGRLDFWTLENERAGRSRHYDRVLIDEGAYGKPNLMGVWEKAIRPTLIDRRGSAIVASNTNGADPDNFLYQICTDPKYGFVDIHATSYSNPFLPREELEEMRLKSHPLVFAQEVMAEFVDWAGVGLFSRDALLVDGEPVEFPAQADTVFAVIDSAVKDGTENDGTAVSYYAYTKGRGPYPLVCLDWDYVQVAADLLELWLPSVELRLKDLAAQTRARLSPAGVFIEDAASGSVLLMQARRKGLNVTAIDSKLTARGKDGRALEISGQVFRGDVKISRMAFDKTTEFKGQTRNHFLSQVLGFRLGDKQAARRADDLLDTFTYGVELCLGDARVM